MSDGTPGRGQFENAALRAAIDRDQYAAGSCICHAEWKTLGMTERTQESTSCQVVSQYSIERTIADEQVPVF